MEGDMVVAKVKRETVAACMTCRLCDKLLRESTTISECLHTFCRMCIYEKITEDEIYCCPVCDIDLGGLPLEKLRPDHILQDLRSKIFPLKRRRKERSISSLVSAQAVTTGKRRKALTRKVIRGSGSLTKRTAKKKAEFGVDRTESGSSPETLKKQSSYAEPNHEAINPPAADEVPSLEPTVDFDIALAYSDNEFLQNGEACARRLSTSPYFEFDYADLPAGISEMYCQHASLYFKAVNSLNRLFHKLSGRVRNMQGENEQLKTTASPTELNRLTR